MSKWQRKTPLTRACNSCHQMYETGTGRTPRSAFCSEACSNRFHHELYFTRGGEAVLKQDHRTRFLRRWANRMQSIEYLGGMCKDCGYKDNLAAFEFDHREGRNGAKQIACLLKRQWVNIQPELDKCDLVCANCHNIRTSKRRMYATRAEEIPSNEAYAESAGDEG